MNQPWLRIKAIAFGRQNANDLTQQYCDRALELAIGLGIPLAKECEELMEEINRQCE